MSLANEKIYLRVQGMPWQKIEDQILILNPSVGEAHELNDSAGLIWEALDGSNSLEQVKEIYLEAFDTVQEQALEDIHFVVEEFEKLGLVECQ